MKDRYEISEEEFKEYSKIHFEEGMEKAEEYIEYLRKKHDLEKKVILYYNGCSHCNHKCH